VTRAAVRIASLALSFGLFTASQSQAQINLIAIGTLDQSRAGAWTDLSGLTYDLENGVPANALGGFGSAIAYASGNVFLTLPDRGPNALVYDAAIDNTVSYVNRFHTVTMVLEPNTAGMGLPFVLRPRLDATTLLWSSPPPRL